MNEHQLMHTQLSLFAFFLSLYFKIHFFYFILIFDLHTSDNNCAFSLITVSVCDLVPSLNLELQQTQTQVNVTRTEDEQNLDYKGPKW